MATRIFLISVFFHTLFFSSCSEYPCPPDEIKKNAVLILQGPSVTRSVLLDKYYADSNFSASGVLLAGSYSGILEQQSLIDFDYSSLPSNAIIQKAYLTLYADTTTLFSFYSHKGHYFETFSSNAWQLNRVSGNWNQSAVTWNTVPPTDSAYQILLPESSSESQTYVVDVTSMVTDRIHNPSANFGMLMSLQSLQMEAYISICSRVHTYPQLSPRMEIHYELP